MSELKQEEKFKIELEEVLDKQFPKTNQADPTKPSDNHRAEALILFAFANILFKKYAKEYAKEYLMKCLPEKYKADVANPYSEGRIDGRNQLIEEIISNSNKEV